MGCSVHENKPAEADAESAWRLAEVAGFDMSVVAANLELTPWERILNHGRALALATQLREAMRQRENADA